MVHDDGPVGLNGVRVQFDDERVVSDAGIALAATFAARLGIEALVERCVRLRRDRPGAAGAGPGSRRLVVDVDSFVGEVFGHVKQGRAFGYTRKRGYHPIIATRADTGEVLHIRLRTGSANSSRGMVRFTDELTRGSSGPARPGEAAARRLGVLVG
jgi:hypothetical protein